MSVFLSYSTTNKQEANVIDQYLQGQGYHVMRDIRDIDFKADIQDFCDQIRDCSAAIILISDAFLKSRWCMYEVLQLMKDRKFKKKIIPVIMEDVKIFSAEDRIDYITYWNQKYKTLSDKTKNLEHSQSAEIAEELKLYTYIKNEINTFMTTSGRWKLVTYKSLLQTGFSEIIAEIKKNRDKEQSGQDSVTRKQAPGSYREIHLNLKKNWWKYAAALVVIIGIIVGAAGVTGNLFPSPASATNTVTVLVHGENGKSELILPNRGIVKLVYGDAIISEQINNEGEATFKQIPEYFFTPKAKVEILFYDPLGEPYRAIEDGKLYQLTKGEYISLPVKLFGLEKIRGIVKDFETGDYLEGVRISVQGSKAYSNQYGEFTLNLPKEKQKQFQTIRAFKEGYQTYKLENVPVQADREIPILMKPKE